MHTAEKDLPNLPEDSASLKAMLCSLLAERDREKQCADRQHVASRGHARQAENTTSLSAMRCPQASWASPSPRCAYFLRRITTQLVAFHDNFCVDFFSARFFFATSHRAFIPRHAL